METPKKTLKRLPHLPGIYIFKDKHGGVLYVGKAKDLKKRVSQYFQNGDAGGLPAGRQGEKTSLLVGQIHEIKTISTDSEFDALLLEAKLIRKLTPKYNIISRDDKSPLYIGITMKESMPRIFWLRKNSLPLYPKVLFFGPFQSGKVARTLVRHIRSVIPYCTQRERSGKPCFYTHIGLCDPCPSVIVSVKDKKRQKELIQSYRGNIRKIIAILSGKSLALVHGLERKMRVKAQKEQFEEAARIKDQIEGLRGLLTRHFDPHLYIQNETFTQNIRQQEEESLRSVLAHVYPDMPPIHRIECIDISHTSGKYSTGSLVVLRDGLPSTGEYRRFKILTRDTSNDVAMIAEVLTRRLKHTEWEYPQLLVIDGGKGQVAAAAAILNELKRVEGSLSIPVIGLAKRFEEIIVPKDNDWNVLRLPVSHKGLHMLERIRDESHRFALKYHRLLRRKAFIRA